MWSGASRSKLGLPEVKKGTSARRLAAFDLSASPHRRQRVFPDRAGWLPHLTAAPGGLPPAASLPRLPAQALRMGGVAVRRHAGQRRTFQMDQRPTISPRTMATMGKSQKRKRAW